MKYNELNVSANKSKKRVGRGISAGQGKTAGRGTKGQGARTGLRVKALELVRSYRLLSRVDSVL